MRCKVRILPPFMTKRLAKVCRSTCEDWPAGSGMFEAANV